MGARIVTPKAFDQSRCSDVLLVTVYQSRMLCIELLAADFSDDALLGDRHGVLDFRYELREIGYAVAD
jgi:hypothetical protein